MITPVIYRRVSDVEGAPEFVGFLHENGKSLPVFFNAKTSEAIQTKMDAFLIKHVGDQAEREARIAERKAARIERKSKGAV